VGRDDAGAIRPGEEVLVEQLARDEVVPLVAVRVVARAGGLEVELPPVGLVGEVSLEAGTLAPVSGSGRVMVLADGESAATCACAPGVLNSARW